MYKAKESENMDFIDLCKSMRIVDGTLEYMKSLNVGLMFFNDEPQKFFPYSQIEVVDLRNGPEGDNMTERIFKGPIDSMIKSALTFIRNTVIEERILKIEGQAEACKDHIHLLLSIPPKYSVSNKVGYLKGKTTLMIFGRHANLKYKYGNRSFWCTGYYVSTVGKNKKIIENYIKNQLQEDMMTDQITIKEFIDPFKGSK